MLKVKSMIALLVLAVGAPAFAADAESASQAKAAELQSLIAQTQAHLGELRNAVRNTRPERNKVAVKVGKDLFYTIVYSSAATYLTLSEKVVTDGFKFTRGNSVFSSTVRRLRTIDPAAGTIQGPLPR